MKHFCGQKCDLPSEVNCAGCRYYNKAIGHLYNNSVNYEDKDYSV